LASKVFCMNSNLQFVRCSLPNLGEPLCSLWP
jgi:hypothetical protein